MSAGPFFLHPLLPPALHAGPSSDVIKATHDIKATRLADAWAELQAQADSGEPLTPDSRRLAFADPEFLLRPAVRGIRFQLELLKPDLEQQAAGIHHTIVVFGSARTPSPEGAAELAARAAAAPHDAALQQAAALAARRVSYYEQARAFGRIVGEHALAQPEAERVHICTGGGPGIMEAANRGAHEAGAATIGLNITLPHEQHSNPYITPGLSFKFHYFALRKMHFMLRAKALVVFPGGFGTLDELFECLTLIQTGKAKPIPIVLFDRDYWQRIVNFDEMVAEGMIAAIDPQLMTFVDSADAAWYAIRDFYALNGQAAAPAATAHPAV